MPKISTIGIYASIFALIVAIVAIGYRPPQEVAGVANASPVTADASTETTSVNEVVATTLAANLAQSTNLSVAPNALEYAISAQTKSEFLQADTTVISKPEIVQLTAENRAVQSYTAKAGDTVASVAAQYGITADTVKWANNLTSDTLTESKVLTILPTDGIQYTVKAGDSLASISAKYSVDQTRVVLYNDLDESGIVAGQKLILPGANLPTNERPGYVSPVTTYLTGYSSGWSNGRTWFISGGIGAAGGYAWGNCTSYAYYKRAALGRPIQSLWGNAGSWAYNARQAGYTVNRTPAPGAIIQDSSHVGIVDKVLPNGDLELSEMNYNPPRGTNVISGRTLPAAYVGQYLYIH